VEEEEHMLLPLSSSSHSQSTEDSHRYPTLASHVMPVTAMPVANGACNQPQQIGTGPYRIPRWFYNPSRLRCELFYWSGCCGNSNNFQTFQSCQNLCEVDPCSLPLDQGVGSSRLFRFHFDTVLRLCQQFVFFGAGGNRNNFPTLEECQDQCPESPQVCAVPTSTAPQQCVPGNGCTENGFCHVGANTQSTVCCPKPLPLDRCQQPLNIGVGNANLQRWYFNPMTQTCSACVYKGMQGNENNFLTQQDCENACLAVNPCRIGVPFRNAQLQTVQCSAANPSVCPAGYYCHVGADPSTTVCCQALEANHNGATRCLEPMEKGEGEVTLTRFHFDRETRSCLPFEYRGMRGNTNNFVSKQNCESTCPIWINPCRGSPPVGMDRRPIACSAHQTCPPNTFCHVGADPSTTICCPSMTSTTNSWQQPLLVGSGPHRLARWYFNAVAKQCQPFTYTGLGGNENNFGSKEECVAVCPVFVNPCPFGDPLMKDEQPVHCLAGGPACPVGHFCHLGADAAATMCCLGSSDPCVGDRVEGDGNALLSRFYFDAAARQCKPFVYRGMHGNANNFLSEASCRERCPVQVDPCPLRMSSLSPRAVGLVSCAGTNSCPDEHWCHVGATADTTVCCPNVISDPCLATPRQAGVGDFNAQRWTFDPTTRRCIAFVYHGMRGTANNFLTKENCEQRCPVFENPCKSGEPFSSSGFYTTCSPQQSCPGGHYCHIGAVHNFCCPVLSGDPCGQPADRGIGRSQLARWYWEPNQQVCLPFAYCGLKGTQNNFLSRQDCERTCYELDNPCAGGTPELGSDERPLQCSASNNSTCSPSYWCHIGAGPVTTVCCPGRVPPPDTCSQPMNVGAGDDSLSRWYYDATARVCAQFVYRGRYGNQNNFLTREQCEGTCPVYVNVCPSGSPLLSPSGTTTICSFGGGECGPAHWCHLGLVPEEFQCCPGTPTNPGACTGLPESQGELGAAAPAQQRWYYDETARECRQFVYNGRKGNQNNFLTQEDCEETCSVFDNPCPGPIPLPPQSCSPMGETCGTGAWCHLGATPETTICCPNEGDPCSLPMSRGTGNAQLDRWYYNAQTANCQPFTYTGMRGNANNFLTREACEQRCGPNPCFEGQPYRAADGRPQTCSATATMNTCPVNHFCHIGADSQTTVCCPGATTGVCNLPMSTGEGNANLERFYFDAMTRTCRPFVYNGLKGNQNNFVSLRSCQLACQPFDNPCIGQPAVTAAGQVLFCSSTNKDACPVNFWCHIGATPETTVCCPGATNACSVPLAPGTGNNGLSRWYYNPDDRECVPFQYNGKRGNQNNFETQTECMRTCPEQLCLLSIDRGACGGRQTRYAFNRQT
ncbi:hypothetical protein PMAYCL1PPCAC_30056, partial [Pristionchus mayeri]